MKILCLDLDGVLHAYTGWNNGTLNGPNDGAVEFCREAVKHFEVYVVSSRCNDEAGMNTVLNWLGTHGFPEEMVVTCERPPAFVSLDDRALTFNGQWPQVKELLDFQPWWKKEPPEVVFLPGEIAMEEMQKRMHLLASHDAKEYGFALATVENDPMDKTIIPTIKDMVRFNFERTVKKYPVLKDWAFVTGPVKEVWRYEPCLNSPDDGESCFEDCDYCDGVGMVPVEIIPGKLEYSFGWYSIALNEGS